MQRDRINGKNRKAVADVILVSLCLLVSLFAFLLMEIFRNEGTAIVIYIDSEEYMECPLDKDGAYTLPGGKNTVTVEGGKVYMSHSECPDHRCEKMGKKSRTGQSIDCLPNRVRVVVVGGDDEIIGVR